MDRKKTNNVTAVIPCYNDGAYIQEALDSLLNQTIVPDKIIIVDDGSDVLTRSIIQKINHPIISIIYQENLGVAAARNNAISKVETTFVLTLDADDTFEPTFIEKALVAIKSVPEIVAVCCHYKKFKKQKPYGDVIKPLGGSAVSFLVKNNGIACALFKKEIWESVNGYDTNFDKGYEDWEFWISALKNNNVMYVIPEVLFFYRTKDVSRDQIALSKHDLSLKKQIFNKHQDLYLEHFEKVYLELIWRQKASLQTVVNIKNGKTYKVGIAILSPIRFLKSIFK
jgi:glycosyltransferase involved in cell wall biosynthesis